MQIRTQENGVYRKGKHRNVMSEHGQGTGTGTGLNLKENIEGSIGDSQFKCGTKFRESLELV